MSTPKTNVRVEDWDTTDRTISVLIDYTPVHDLTITAVISYDHGRSLFFDTLLDSDGNDLRSTLPPSLLKLLIHTIHTQFNPIAIAREWITESQAHSVFETYSTSFPIDWDARAKDLRMDREEEAFWGA